MSLIGSVGGMFGGSQPPANSGGSSEETPPVEEAGAGDSTGDSNSTGSGGASGASGSSGSGGTGDVGSGDAGGSTESAGSGASGGSTGSTGVSQPSSAIASVSSAGATAQSAFVANDAETEITGPSSADPVAEFREFVASLHDELLESGAKPEDERLQALRSALARLQEAPDEARGLFRELLKSASSSAEEDRRATQAKSFEAQQAHQATDRAQAGYARAKGMSGAAV